MTFRQELELIRTRHHGVLRPQNVVDFARNRRTALHSKFCWDNTEAGKKYRLWQARQLISITITVETPDVPSHRVYVSMRRDRQLPDGGYRSTVEVLSEDESRRQLLNEAMAEFQSMKRRYGHLKELVEIFAAIDRLQR